MGLLTPLYIAGLLAVSLPLAFHLNRRTPKGEVPFSSLMFLSPSPPRLTRRSRLDQLFLLFLRGLALTLLALAFARPFLRQAASDVAADAPQERIAILLDRSVSMRRDDMWQQAVELAENVVTEARPTDQIGVYAFDETLRPVASFEDMAQVAPARREAVVQERLARFSPGWASTQLGQAIVDVIDLAGESQDATEQVGRAPRRIVLISDMQVGSRAEMLGEYDWPDDVFVELAPVAPRRASNAGLQRLADESASDAIARGGRDRLRIRVANASDSQTEQFRLNWTDAAGEPVDESVDVYVPAGESRVVRAAPPTDAAGVYRLELNGDDHDFDNKLYCVQQSRQPLKVPYLGADRADDPQGSRYYLETALGSDASQDIQLEPIAPDGPLTIDPANAPPLIVATTAPTLQQAAQLHDYVADGGAVLYVLSEGDDGASLAELVGVDELAVTEADVSGYAMLQDIDFSHPLFAPMAGPQFNDFTQIRFWNYRKLEEWVVGDARIDVRVVARFETGDPAVLEQQIGAGRVLVFAAGWEPSDGQLARSWKFLLMMSSLVDSLRPERGFRDDFVVNQPVTLPEGLELAANRMVAKPDGSEVQLPSDATALAVADQPGIYLLATVNGPVRFAVNLDPAESDTLPLSVEEFEQLGCRLTGNEQSAGDEELKKQLRDVELERRQGGWKWIVMAILAVLLVETWWAGRALRQSAYELAPG